MDTLSLAWLLDIVIVVLLGATIVYAWILNRRLIAIRNGRGELDQLVRALSEAVTRAEGAINGMRNTAVEADAKMSRGRDGAQILADELAIAIQSGERLSERLEAVISEARGIVASGAAAPGPATADDVIELRNPLPPEAPAKPQGPLARDTHDRRDTRNMRHAGDDRVIRFGGRKAAGAEAPAAAPRRPVNEEPAVAPARAQDLPQRTRSRAEQELLEAIRNLG